MATGRYRIWLRLGSGLGVLKSCGSLLNQPTQLISISTLAVSTEMMIIAYSPGPLLLFSLHCSPWTRWTLHPDLHPFISDIFRLAQVCLSQHT